MQVPLGVVNLQVFKIANFGTIGQIKATLGIYAKPSSTMFQAPFSSDQFVYLHDNTETHYLQYNATTQYTTNTSTFQTFWSTACEAMNMATI